MPPAAPPGIGIRVRSETGQRHRIDVHAVLRHLEVDMGPRRIACRARVSDQVAAIDLLPVGDGPPRQVAQGDDVGMPVYIARIDVDSDTARFGVPVRGNARDRSVLGRALAAAETAP